MSKEINMITKVDTKELRELHGKASKGEWAWHWRADDKLWPGSIYAKGDSTALAVAMCPRYRSQEHNNGWENDAALVVAMKNSLPALLDELDARRQQAMNLTPKQLREMLAAAEAISGGDEDYQVAFSYAPEPFEGEGGERPAGWYAYDPEYPQEGSIDIEGMEP